MSSVRSILIRTCMTNVQKEISQLEHWLNNLSDDSPVNVPIQPTHSYDEHFELSNLNRVIERLAEDVSNQRDTLNNILERIDNLEGFKRPNREVFIDENGNQESNCNDPWLDNNCESLENEVIGEDNISEPLYTHNKSVSAESSVVTPTIIPDVPEDNSVLPDINSDNEEETPNHTKQEVKQQKKQQDKEEEQQEEQEEEEEEEQEEEQEEEEDAQEFEEIEYKGNRYYKDNENFIYSVDDNDDPSENPIGYWKEKTQTIAFYKTK